MRRAKEIIVLLVLLAGMMIFVLWYVIDRRAKMRTPAGPAVAPQSVATPPAPPVDLTKYDGQTIDFSSGQPVVKNSAEDQAATAAALRDMAAATKDVTFEAAPAATPAAPEK